MRIAELALEAPGRRNPDRGRGHHDPSADWRAGWKLAGAEDGVQQALFGSIGTKPPGGVEESGSGGAVNLGSELSIVEARPEATEAVLVSRSLVRG